MKWKSGILLAVISFLLIGLPYSAAAKVRTDFNFDCSKGAFSANNNSDSLQSGLYNEILNLINIDKKKNNVTIDMNSKLDSTLMCLNKIGKYIEGKIIKIFYHDSEYVFFNLENLYKYLNDNNYKAVNSCMADGPDGTEQAYLKNGVMLLVMGQWDGGDDSDKTYIPSKYFEFTFYIVKLDQPDRVIISILNKW